MASKSHKGEEPVGWVTVEGKHFPKWKDGTIGWQDGQEESPKKKSSYTVMMNSKDGFKEAKTFSSAAEADDYVTAQIKSGNGISTDWTIKHKTDETGIPTTSRNARYDTSKATHSTSSNTDVPKLSNGKSQLPNIRSTKNKTYSKGEKVAASVGVLGNNKKAIKHLKSENRRSMLIEIAENAGVSSSKLRKMDTEDIRAMLLSMLN